jgi:uncharacterized 2Fe-2S/4Fe-4S cluster protein (DUF4445 family)
LVTQHSGHHTVDLEPVGRRVRIRAGESLLDAARAAGVELVSLCGGEGWCGGCAVRLLSGAASSPTASEVEAFSPAQLKAGFRLACQTVPFGDVKIDIPPDSLTAPQRLQVEGLEAPVEVDPAVVAVDVSMPAPTLEDLRSDLTRLNDALAAAGLPAVRPRRAILEDLSERLRAEGWQPRLAVRGHELAAILSRGSRLFGLALDVGTTKLAGYLVALEDGSTAAKAGAMNPQIAYGEDVVSRIAYAGEHADGRRILHDRLIEAVNEMARQLCDTAGASLEQVVEAVVVGNTAMHHFFAGLPVAQLGRAPYVPAVSDPLEVQARDIGLEIAHGATAYLPPNVAGYVGADHVAMALATRVWEAQGTVVALDIGTNTEISLAARGRVLCCSCASGPAFEGAHIRDGMRAAPGAIERVKFSHGELRLHTIDNAPPVGICGSGILDSVAALLDEGILDRRGRFDDSRPRVSKPPDGVVQYLLAPARQTGHGRDVVVTRQDVNEIQLAKGAIRTGLEVLLAEAGIDSGQIEQFIVAGAFGTYLDLGSAIRVGMFPDLPHERFSQVGNAAGAGARQMLVSAAMRRKIAGLLPRVEYVELTTHPQFTKKFLASLYF